jgi:glutamate/tyrosine decarboxylase-like PLP-dependent enzyme
VPNERFAEVLDDLRRRSLHPTEHNRAELADRVQVALSALPSPCSGNDPWLGTSTPDFGWLEEFERIPERMGDRDQVLTAVAGALAGQLRWHAPGSVFNATPVPMLDTVATTAMANLYSPNALWDLTSAGALEVERQVVRQLAGLAGWDADSAGGTFSFGGKAGMIHAIRLGLTRCRPASPIEGLGAGPTPMVVTTEHNHDCVEEVCALLGLGASACVRVQAAADVAATTERVIAAIERLVAEGTAIACVVLSGGSIVEMAVDRVRPIANHLSAVHRRVGYRPYLHLDTAFGWPWLFFSGYDFHANELGIETAALGSLQRVSRLLAEVNAADSMTADFHKIGFCPYSSSVFLTRDRSELSEPAWRPWGENIVSGYTIEHSRSASGILAAWVALQSAGQVGFQVQLAHATATNIHFRQALPGMGYELLNPDSDGLSSVYWPVAPGGPASFAELRRSDPTLIDDANRYTQKLYWRLTGLDGGHGGHVMLGMLPSYGRGDHGDPMAALRIFPGSPHHDETTVGDIVELMFLAKKEFDAHVGQRHHAMDGLRLQRVPE